jgi:hypothetical protein
MTVVSGALRPAAPRKGGANGAWLDVRTDRPRFQAGTIVGDPIGDAVQMGRNSAAGKITGGSVVL